MVFGDIGIRGDLCIETDNEIVRERGFGLRERWENWNFVQVEFKGVRGSPLLRKYFD